MASYFLPFESSSWTLFSTPAIVLGAFLTWRLWRFSLAPIYSPNEPEQLPYWIPFLGHALTFAKNPQTLFVLGQKRFSRVGRPYGLTVAGQTLYVLTDPRDFTIVYRNAATFTFDPLVEQIYKLFQVPETAVRKLYCKASSSNAISRTSNLPEEDAVNISHNMIVVEMRGKQTHSPAERTARYLENMMDLQSICTRFSTLRDRNSTVVSLSKICSVLMTAAGQAHYFGDALSAVDPLLPEAFVDFDRLCWQMFFRPPIFWSKQLKDWRAKLLTALEAYSNKPKEERSDMPQFLQSWETECRKAGLHDSEIAILMLIQYFGLNTNTPEACFWLLCYTLFNPELIRIIRNETSAAFASDTLNYDIIESSRALNGIWLETLRISASSVSVRYITQDFELKGVKLRKGNQVLLNARLLHIDPEYFGADPLDFDAKRFVDNVGYQRHPAFRPFGGGEAQCPGRQMAKQTALTFVAYMLYKYEIQLIYPHEFPKPNHDNHPGAAIMAPAEGQDLLVRLTERRKNECS